MVIWMRPPPDPVTRTPETVDSPASRATGERISATRSRPSSQFVDRLVRDQPTVPDDGDVPADPFHLGQIVGGHQDRPAGLDPVPEQVLEAALDERGRVHRWARRGSTRPDRSGRRQSAPVSAAYPWNTSPAGVTTRRGQVPVHRGESGSRRTGALWLRRAAKSSCARPGHVGVEGTGLDEVAEPGAGGEPIAPGIVAVGSGSGPTWAEETRGERESWSSCQRHSARGSHGWSPAQRPGPGRRRRAADRSGASVVRPGSRLRPSCEHHPGDGATRGLDRGPALQQPGPRRSGPSRRRGWSRS